MSSKAKKVVTSVDHDGKKYGVPISQLVWRPSAYGIVLNKGKVLLSPQFSENQYDLPGGGVDLGEIPEDAAIREVKEETGLVVAGPRIIDVASGYFTFEYTEASSTPVHIQSLMFYYVCDLVGGELSTEGFDDYEKEYAQLAVWFPVAQLDSIKVASSFDWRDLVKKAAS